MADAGVRADHERQRADALHTGLATAETAITELRAGLAVAEHDAQAALDAAEAIRNAEAERKAQGALGPAPGRVEGRIAMPAADDLRRVLRRAGRRPRTVLRGFWVRLRAAWHGG